MLNEFLLGITVVGGIIAYFSPGGPPDRSDDYSFIHHEPPNDGFVSGVAVGYALGKRAGEQENRD